MPLRGTFLQLSAIRHSSGRTVYDSRVLIYDILGVAYVADCIPTRARHTFIYVSLLTGMTQRSSVGWDAWDRGVASQIADLGSARASAACWFSCMTASRGTWNCFCCMVFDHGWVSAPSVRRWVKKSKIQMLVLHVVYMFSSTYFHRVVDLKFAVTSLLVRSISLLCVNKLNCFKSRLIGLTSV